MKIYNNNYARYNALSILFLALYSQSATLPRGIFRTIVSAVSLISLLILIEVSQREYYKLVNHIAKTTKQED